MYDFGTDTSTSEGNKKFILSQPKMHKSVMKNRRLLYSSIAIFIFLLVSDITTTNAVPTDSSGVLQHAARPLLLHRALRDVATIMTASLMQEEHKDMVTSTETLLDQPQGQCLLDGTLVAETSVECEKKVGCRAIQKTGHCCPDYKCDCEKDGKTYLNGDKLVDPETPCTVCYCKGGEILCSSAVCFHRDDCTPRYIPGRCCPEYDNCPVANKTMITSTPPSKPESPPASGLNLNITIKEITKPTEIRITDDNKAKPIHQMLKTSTTTPSTTTTLSSTSSSSSTTPRTLMLIKVTDSPLVTEKHHNSESLYTPVPPVELPEYHPENPISQELHRVDNDLGNNSSKVNIKREFMFGSTEGPVNISYIEALSDLTSADLLFGSVDLDPVEYNNSSLQTDVDIDPETAGSDNIYHIILSTDGPGDSVSSSTESGTISKLLSTTEGYNREHTTERINERITTDAPTKVPDSTTEFLESSKSTDHGVTETSKTTTHHHLEEEDSALPMESNPAYPSLPEDDFSIRDVNLPLSEVDDTAEADIKDEQRSIGSSFSSHKVISVKPSEEGSIDGGSGSGSDLTHITDDIELSSTRSHSTESTPIIVSKNVPLMYSSEESSSAETAISNSTEFKIEKVLHDAGENETGSGESLEISSLDTIIGSELDGGSGSGNGNDSIELTKVISSLRDIQKQKQREPTTPRPTRKPTTEVDIDELGDASGDGKSEPIEDPKLDVESLKIDEKANDGIVQMDSTAPKNDIISIKVNPTQDKTFEELVPKTPNVVAN